MDWYQLADSWAEDFADGAKWELPTSLQPRLAGGANFGHLLADPESDDLMDTENSIRLHKALPDLTPAQARDPRLWTRLTHVEFWAYMRRRWPIERHLANRKKTERYVEERHFVARSEGRALLRNGMARLWWYAHLTHDAGRDNPYELTAVLLKNLDITQQILERSMGRCRAVLVAFLEFLMQNPGLLEGGDANRTKIRVLAKSLNLYGGVAVLDCLDPATLKNHLAAELERVQSPEPTVPAGSPGS